MKIPYHEMEVKQEHEQYHLHSRNASFKIDEGFVDDTRSLDDGDSTMGLEPRSVEPIGILPDPLVTLSQAIMSLSESQRSGKVLTEP